MLKTLPRSGGKLLVDAGEENAGLVDLGEDLATAFKIEFIITLQLLSLMKEQQLVLVVS